MDYAGKFGSRDKGEKKNNQGTITARISHFIPVFKVSGPLTFVNYIHSGQNRL
jgi:hypothetical protein